MALALLNVPMARLTLLPLVFAVQTEGPGSDAPPFFRTTPTSTAALAVSAGFFAFELVVTLKYWVSLS